MTTTRLNDRMTESARDAMVRRHLPLARSLARRYRHTQEPLEDLVQVASMGLIKAVDRWDPDRGVAFSSFAVPTILGELRRHFRSFAWMVRPPRPLQELIFAVERERDRARGELARERCEGSRGTPRARPGRGQGGTGRERGALDAVVRGRSSRQDRRGR